MAFIRYNANPFNNDTIDCVIRGISKVMDITWDEAYIRLFVKGYELKEIFSRNNVWSEFLEDNGYKQYLVPDMCPNCITVDEFSNTHTDGKYLLGTGSHVIAVVNGDYYDTWDSGNEPKEHLITEMKRMMQDLSPHEKMAVQDCINKMEG